MQFLVRALFPHLAFSSECTELGETERKRQEEREERERKERSKELPHLIL